MSTRVDSANTERELKAGNTILKDYGRVKVGHVREHWRGGPIQISCQGSQYNSGLALCFFKWASSIQLIMGWQYDQIIGLVGSIGS